MSTSPLDFRDLTVAKLRSAAEVYLDHAYPGGEPPEPVRRRLAWPEVGSVAELVAGPPFEQVQPADGEGSTIYALRLGNHRYPHMKFQVQPWPTSVGYMLSVNTHDQILGLNPEAPDAQAFRDLQTENQKIKETIEESWDQGGFPTFLRYLRDYLDTHPTPGSDES